MAKVDPYYSYREKDPKVHHDDNKCPEGKIIESYNRSAGTGDRPLCEQCHQLS
jgi:hypothetical protein